MRLVLPLLPILLATTALAEPIAVECRPGAPTICLATDPNAPSALVALTLPVGSADEGAREHGLAHYVEHLTFRNRVLEDGEAVPTGAGIDGFGNAYTSPWATTYHWTVPPARASEAVARAMAVLDPLDVTEDAAAQEREIVAREREEREDAPGARDALMLDARLFEGSPLARSVIGTAGEIAALDLVAAQAFHARHYDPATAVLVLAGDVGWDAAAALVGQGMAAPRRPPAVAAAPADPVAASREDVVQRPERWHVALAPLPAGPAALSALWVIDAYLASSMPDAPGQALVRGRDDLRDAWARVHETVPGLGSVDAGIVLRPGLAPADLAAPWDAWEDLWAALVRGGLDEATVTRLRDRLVRDEARAREDGIAAAWSLVTWLESGATFADWAAWPDHLGAVTAQDVAVVLRALDAPVRAVTLDTLPTGSGPSQDISQ